MIDIKKVELELHELDYVLDLLDEALELTVRPNEIKTARQIHRKISRVSGKKDAPITFPIGFMR